MKIIKLWLWAYKTSDGFSDFRKAVFAANYVVAKDIKWRLAVKKLMKICRDDHELDIACFVISRGFTYKGVSVG